MQDTVIAISTYDLTLQKITATLGDAISKPLKDPQHSGKAGDSIAKIRVLPTDRKPAEFWSPAWCFYEIGVGRYEIQRANFGGVQFVMYPDNKKCGAGKYRNGVTRILRGLNPEGRKGFFLDLQGGPEGAAILCGFHYCLGEFDSFSAERGADDLSWLINSTMRSFAALV